MKSAFCILTTVLTLVASTLWAAEPGAKKDAAGPEVVRLTVHPAGLPVPALKYRLLPEYIEQTPGDAAPLYMKAFLLMAEAKSDEAAWDRIVKWLETPPEKLPQHEVEETLAKFKNALHQVEMAARRSECDWGLPVREEGENIFSILLPEVSVARNVGRLLALRARLHIAKKDCEAALADLKTGMALARHVATAPLLVNGLVGLAISGQMQGQLLVMTQSAGAPNLYWSLTALPDPLVDLRPGLELESCSVYLIFPEMQPARRAGYTPEQWNALLDTVVKRPASLTDSVEGPDQKGPELWQQLLVKAAVSAMVPEARKDLIGRGWPAQEVDRMAPAQVVVLDILGAWEEYRDELFKWLNVPYWQAAEGLGQAVTKLEQARNAKSLLARCKMSLPATLLPALGKVRFAAVKSQRQLAALRCIEAMRFYAASHQGTLPARLDQIAELPIPVNPVTGKAFPYRIEGDEAVLVADGGPAPDKQVEYRIRVAK